MTHSSHRTSLTPESLIGRILDEKYELTVCLSPTRPAAVYRARSRDGSPDVAVKVLLVGEPESDLCKRFRRESRATAAIDHPNVIRILETADTRDGLTFFIMELLEGETLLDYLRQSGPLPLRRAVELFTPVCAAIHTAHRAGLVHRDVKTGNVFLHRPPGRPEQVKVLDFGIARPGWELADEDDRITGEGIVIGTPEFMSPEQCRGEEVGPASDIYSLGVMLYKMLTGASPFDGPTTAVLARHIGTEPPPLRSRRPNLPPEIERVVLTALAKEPDQRYPSALAFGETFAQVVDSLCGDSTDCIHRGVSPPEVASSALASQTVVLSPADVAFLTANPEMCLLPEKKSDTTS